MFAVVEINDKQHLVEEGKIFSIDGNIESKKTTFDNVLMIQNDSDIEFGAPYINNVSIEAEVIESGKREKDIVFKFKRKTGYKVTRGHRQNTTLLRITKINIKANNKSKKDAAETKSTTTKTETKKTTAKTTTTTKSTNKTTTSKS